MTTANVGLLIHDGPDAFGATFGVVGVDAGNEAEGVSVLYAGRYRRYLGRWGLAGDVQLGYAGGPTLEIALGWYDVIAVTAGVNSYEIEGGGRDVVAGVGLRVGAVAIGGVFYLAAMMATSTRR